MLSWPNAGVATLSAKIDETGHRYGRLIVLSEATKRGGHGSMRRKCLCDCGTVVERVGMDLRTGDTKSCGCLRRETTAISRRTEGKSQEPGYAAYKSARARCRNPNSQGYPRYGGRGIEFRFESYEDWVLALGPRPSSQHSVDRIDNDGHYEPGNVRWATPKQQVQNQKCPCANCGLLRGHM